MAGVAEALWVAIVLYVVYLLVKYRRTGIFTPDVAGAYGPPQLPLFGNYFLYDKWEHRMPELAVSFQRRYGAGWTTSIPFLRMVDVSRPDWLQHVQKDRFANYVKGKVFSDILGDVLGRGIFVVDGPQWHVQRKTTSNIFSGRSFRDIISPAIDESVDVLHRIMDRHSSSGDGFNLAHVFSNLTLETFVKMAFGQNVGALRVESDEPVPFARAFDLLQEGLDTRFQIFIGWSVYEWATSQGRRMREALKLVDDYVYSLIDARPTAKAEHRDLLGLYMSARDEQGQAMTRQELRDAVLNLVIAGRDTTAQALTWTFWRLISTKKHLAPIREEVDRVLGDGGVTYDNYRSLVYTVAVFNEALRLHPSVSKNAKVALADDQIPNGGPTIKAGDLVRWSDWAMARDPTIWGEDCCEFRPERWVSDGRPKQYSPWVAHAFNGGPRLCLGMSLATFEAVAVIVELVRHFDLDFAPGWWESVPKTVGLIEGEESPLYTASLTHPMAQPFMVTVRRCNSHP